MTCPNCQGAHTTLIGKEEGWNASGPHGVHTIKRHNRCRDCGHEWTETLKDTDWEVVETYPDMDHCAEVRHETCGAKVVVTVGQFRGQKPITCAGCDFTGKVDLS